MSFGAYLRALRLGYHPLPEPASGMMRMSPYGTDGAICRLIPATGLATKTAAGPDEHYVWWEKDGGRELIQSSPVLRAITRVNKPFAVALDHDGMPVGGG